jgi:hypothetical protein
MSERENLYRRRFVSTRLAATLLADGPASSATASILAACRQDHGLPTVPGDTKRLAFDLLYERKILLGNHAAKDERYDKS